MTDHQRPHSESLGQLPTEVGDPPGQRMQERPVECHTRIPGSQRPVVVEDDQAGDEISYSVCPLVTPREIALSDSEKAEALADTLEAQY